MVRGRGKNAYVVCYLIKKAKGICQEHKMFLRWAKSELWAVVRIRSKNKIYQNNKKKRAMKHWQLLPSKLYVG